MTLSITQKYLNYVIPNHKGVDMKAWNFLGHVFRDLEIYVSAKKTLEIIKCSQSR